MAHAWHVLLRLGTRLFKVVHGEGMRLNEPRRDRVGVVGFVPAQLWAGDQARRTAGVRRLQALFTGAPHPTCNERIPCAVSIVTPRT